ncbi:hypothetical protein [Maribacter sp. 2210JD10-5]|uniref:hypothetical protein n=1 Tax=Maribacter sp. 2210JD10-5 TaxID=3386272 RepID=UPI0039BD4D39
MDTLYKKMLLFSVAIFLGHLVTAQEKVSKQIKKDFTVNGEAALHLENKYGDIRLYGWDQNKISVAITVTVTRRKKEQAEELLKRIRPKLTSSGTLVDVSYEVEEKNSGFFAKYFNKANPFDFDRSNLQIDYIIYMPTDATLKVTNKFGDVVLEDWKGKLRANIEHGNLWINENLSKADVEMKYGKLRAKSLDYAALRIKNASLNMDASKSLRINSSGSTLVIGKTASLEIYSSKDEIKIEEMGSMYGTLKFTNVAIHKLKKDIDLNMKIADFRVNTIIDPKSEINIDQESSEVSLIITDFPHRFEATLEEGLVRLPKSYKNIDSKMLDKGKRLRKISASYGKNPNGKVTITGKKGLVLMKEID